MADKAVLYESDRVILRRMTSADEAEFTELAWNSRELHRPWIYAPQSFDEFSRYLERFDGNQAECTLICHRKSGEIAGFVSINEIIRGPYQRASVGYGIFTPNERQGYMKEGFELVFRFAFGKAEGDLRLHRLEADIQPDNEASVGLAKTVGFEREGASSAYILVNEQWADHERYAITSEVAVRRGVLSCDEAQYAPPLENQSQELVDAV